MDTAASKNSDRHRVDKPSPLKRPAPEMKDTPVVAKIAKAADIAPETPRKVTTLPPATSLCSDRSSSSSDEEEDKEEEIVERPPTPADPALDPPCDENEDSGEDEVDTGDTEEEDDDANAADRFEKPTE